MKVFRKEQSTLQIMQKTSSNNTILELFDIADVNFIGKLNFKSIIGEIASVLCWKSYFPSIYMAARAMRLIRAVKATRAIRVTGATRYAREGGHECRSDCTDACFRVKKIPGK